MDLASEIVRIVPADANVIINLIHINSLGLLSRLPNYEFVVPDEVVREVTEPGQRAALQVAIKSGAPRIITIDDIATLKLFTELSSVMGAGEAACLSLAQTRGWFVASDEKESFPPGSRSSFRLRTDHQYRRYSRARDPRGRDLHRGSRSDEG